MQDYYEDWEDRPEEVLDETEEDELLDLDDEYDTTAEELEHKHWRKPIRRWNSDDE